MERYEGWRPVIAAALGWREAHVSFEDAVAGLPGDVRGVRPPGYPHSVWELVEHIRLAQADLVDFMEDDAYSAPAWPDDYWPHAPAPPSPAAWEAALESVRRDRERLAAVAARPTLELATAIPGGTGQTYLRTLLVAVDHAAYHVGQIVAVRRLLGAWPRDAG
jgi:uncharacterized damage-inducible protein DinB